MATIEWQAGMSVGIAELDEDHRRWMAILQRLARAQAEGKTQDQILVIMDDLVDYTRGHLAREERLLSERGYPELENHKGQHRWLTDWIVAARRDALDGADEWLNEDLLGVMRNWLIDHIMEHDMAYARYFRAS